MRIDVSECARRFFSCFDLMYDSFIGFWNKFEPVIYAIREDYGPKTWEDLEYLRDEMARLKEKENPQKPNR